MRTPILLFLILFLNSHINVQSQSWQRAYLNSDMTVTSEAVSAPACTNNAKTNISQINGFPIAVPANPSFKNMRNLTLSDMNGDGIDDIIFATDNKLYVYTFQGLLWSATLTGTAIYPPSIGDVNGDGHPDIVQVTGGSPANGRIHVFDRFGNAHSGWPVSFNNNWILCAPALSDLNGNGKMEIIVNERINTAGKIHILKHDGTTFSPSWPILLDGVPAVTPSVADVDNDGEKDIVICSTKSRYIFGLNGQAKIGFPLVTAPGQGYSYQSPIIVDFDSDNVPEIVGATHGDLPQFYVMHNDNSNYQAWPIDVPDNYWTYSTPTVVKINEQWHIFMSRPTGSDTLEMLYGWDKNGNMLPHFPIVKPGGLEGYISVADITDDSDFELIFGSNLKDNNGDGFIHAYKMDGSGELPGFPLKPKGFTFMNGICIGDINGNGKTNLVALSYDLNFGAEPDSVYINAYQLDANYNSSKVLWGTYKGSNTRTGDYTEIVGAVKNRLDSHNEIKLYPNPVNDFLNIEFNQNNNSEHTIIITDIIGRAVYTHTFNGIAGNNIQKINVKHLNKGVYNISIHTKNGINYSGRFIL